MLTTRQIRSRFTDKHILKLMRGVLREKYEGSLRYVPHKGVTETTCLSMNITPLIESKVYSGVNYFAVRVQYQPPRRDYTNKTMPIKITIEGPNEGKVLSGYDYENKQPKYSDYRKSIDRLICRALTSDYLVEDKTSIPIYI